jgi:hypothetical protein
MEEPSALDDAAAGGGRGGWDCKGMEDDAGEELANRWSRAFNAIALPKEYIGTTSNHIKKWLYRRRSASARALPGSWL